MRRWSTIFAAVMMAALLAAQQKPAQPVPDAPSSARPIPKELPPLPTGSAQPRTTPQDSSSTKPPEAKPQEAETAAPPATAQPALSAPRPRDPEDSGRDEAFKLVSNVNFVVVPVTVKDNNGKLVDGLLRRDFALLENDVPQNLALFTSDPFPLSAAIVVDTGMPDMVLKKVQDSLTALAGAFSQFDEVGLYTFGATVEQIAPFATSADEIASGIKRLAVYSLPGEMSRRRQGGASTVPVTGGPLNSPPTINGRPVEPNAPIVPVVHMPARVLNDAVLRAARDLSRRERARRKVLFIITDGKESGSSARYADVLKVLLTNDITVYGLGVGATATPIIGRLEKVHVPFLQQGELLPKYASATGGSVLDAFDRKGIEEAYANTTLQARNQYTLGYTTRATASTSYRQIEVVVHRPNLTVTAKTGYYPLPPEKPAPPESKEK